MQDGGFSFFLAYPYPKFCSEGGSYDCKTQYEKLQFSISWAAVGPLITPLCLPWRARSGVKVKGTLQVTSVCSLSLSPPHAPVRNHDFVRKLV